MFFTSFAGSAPNVGIQITSTVECIVPGVHVGPMSAGTKGWAILNAARHKGSPNILYADGHAAADANRRIGSGDLGSCPAGNWNGLQATSWDDYMAQDFGTMWHIIPQQRFD